jgi:hypothetical protein
VHNKDPYWKIRCKLFDAIQQLSLVSLYTWWWPSIRAETCSVKKNKCWYDSVYCLKYRILLCRLHTSVYILCTFLWHTTGSILLTSTRTSFSDFLCAVSTVNYFMQLTNLPHGCCHIIMPCDRWAPNIIMVKRVANTNMRVNITQQLVRFICDAKAKFIIFRTWNTGVIYQNDYIISAEKAEKLCFFKG